MEQCGLRFGSRRLWNRNSDAPQLTARDDDVDTADIEETYHFPFHHPVQIIWKYIIEYRLEPNRAIKDIIQYHFQQDRSSQSMPVPALPAPAHPDDSSMLTAKFGREVANYFSGSPLNRVGFLRAEAGFLASAARHPTARFLPMRELQPLVEGNSLAWTSFEDVKPVIGSDVYSLSEEETIRTFRSDKHVPQMIFLGLDESVRPSFEYRATSKKTTYSGAPRFAVDVTPRASVKEACEALAKELEGRGLKFAQGRVMDLKAPEGELRWCMAKMPSDQNMLTFTSSCDLRRSPPASRLEPPQPLLRPVRPANSLRQRRV